MNDSTTRLQLAVTYLHRKNKLKLSGIIPSLKRDKEQLDNLLLSVSRALNDTIILGANTNKSESGGQNSINDGEPIALVQGTTANNTSNTDNFSEESSFDMSEYDRIYSPILSPPELNVFKQLSFTLSENPRMIKRILNIYSLARAYRSYKYNVDTFDILSKKMMKFIMLLERWPYATSLMIEVITRLNYERDDVNNDLDFDKKRFNNHKRNFDRKELCDRILSHFEGVTDYNYLELYCLYGALEELIGHDSGAFKNSLSRDHDIRLF